MGRLINTPSGGQSEVLETLHYQGATDKAPGVQLFRIGDLVSKRWRGSEKRMGSDPQFETDTLTVLGQLQTAGYVVGRNDQTSAVVDLTAGTPAGTTRVNLTGAGRVKARAPKPRPRRIN